MQYTTIATATGRKQLVDLLHLGALIVLERREVIVLILLNSIVLVDRQAELDHVVDAASEGGGLVKVEARGQERRVEKEPDEILDRLVVLVVVGALAESVDDGVGRVDLERLLRGHVPRHGAVLEGL